ncbi:hypothetical protein V8F06_012406 [Rhypophila decipiens]
MGCCLSRPVPSQGHGDRDRHREDRLGARQERPRHRPSQDPAQGEAGPSNYRDAIELAAVITPPDNVELDISIPRGDQDKSKGKGKEKDMTPYPAPPVTTAASQPGPSSSTRRHRRGRSRSRSASASDRAQGENSASVSCQGSRKDSTHQHHHHHQRRHHRDRDREHPADMDKSSDRHSVSDKHGDRRKEKHKHKDKTQMKSSGTSSHKHKHKHRNNKVSRASTGTNENQHPRAAHAPPTAEQQPFRLQSLPPVPPEAMNDPTPSLINHHANITIPPQQGHHAPTGGDHLPTSHVQETLYPHIHTPTPRPTTTGGIAPPPWVDTLDSDTAGH